MSEIDEDFGGDDISVGGEDARFNEDVGNDVGKVRIGRREYAVGLHWDRISDPAKADAVARELARQGHINADFYCVRHAGTQQVGFGFKSSHHKVNLPSLAVHLAYVNGDNWAGLFEVPGGYYVIAIHEDGIYSETDKFFESSENALEWFDEIRTNLDSDTVYAPEEFAIAGAKTVPLETLLTGKPQVRLKSVSRGGLLVKLLLAGLLVGGGIAGLNFYFDSLEAERLRAEAARLAQQAQRSIGVQPEEIEIPPMPWEGKYQGVPVLKGCVDSIRKFTASVPGWSVQEMVCSDTVGSARLARVGQLEDGGGSINWIRKYVEREGFTPIVNYPGTGSKDVVSVDWELERPPQIPVDLKTAPVRDIQVALLTTFEGRQTSISMQPADHNDFWRGVSFSFKTDRDPLVFTDVLGAVPGVMITQIHYDIKSSTWSIEGKAYEQLPLPEPQAR